MMKDIELRFIWGEPEDEEQKEKEKEEREKKRKFGKFNERGEWVED